MTYGGPPVPEGAQPPSAVYLILEPKSTEVLSGLHIEIIAAATSLIQIRFDGEPFFPLEVRRTVRSSAKQWLGRNKGRHRFYDY